MVLPWYYFGMKTAISVPDTLFAQADALARLQGVSRSELYARAIEEYLARHRDEDVTSRLDALYSGEVAGLERPLRQAQARSVAGDPW